MEPLLLTEARAGRSKLVLLVLFIKLEPSYSANCFAYSYANFFFLLARTRSISSFYWILISFESTCVSSIDCLTLFIRMEALI